MRRMLIAIAAVLALAGWTGAGFAAPAPDAVGTGGGSESGATSVPPDERPVLTPDPDTTPAVTPDDPNAPPPDDATPPADDEGGPPPDLNPPGPVPDVQYDLSALPKPVARIREQIIAAAATGDLEKLRPIFEANDGPPLLGPNDSGDPIAYLKSESGDEGGREILAILTEVLEAGFVHVDVGTPQEIYVWPYFARVPIDKLTPPQLVELFKLVYAGDYVDMLANGQYTFFRAGITPDGVWRYFVLDE